MRFVAPIHSIKDTEVTEKNLLDALRGDKPMKESITVGPCSV